MHRSTPQETLAEELKRYVRFSADDARSVAATRAEVEGSFRTIAEEFYDRIREHAEAHAAFANEDQIERLKTSLVAWLERVFGGTYDEAHFAKAERMGAMHVRIGLPQRYVTAAMSVIRDALCRRISDREACAAVARLLDVELAVMLESYRKNALERLERASRETVVVDPGALMDRAPVVILGVDEDGTIFLANAAAESMTGWARDELRGRRFLEAVVPPDNRSQAAALFQREGMIETGLLLRSGKLRRARWRASFVPGVRDARGAFFLFGADITDELEERAKREQDARASAAANLVAGLAHALRNPLNGAILHLAVAERAAKKNGSPDAVEALRVAGGELQRLGALLTDFFEFARPNPLVLTRSDVRALCSRAVEQAAPLAATKHVAVSADLPTQPLLAEVDIAKLEQTLAHLVENAIDAARSAVVLRARREPHAVIIEIEDDGLGLPAADAPIFDAFYSTKADGTGLGLAIVHRVTADHGGEVAFERRGERTCLRLRLPLVCQGKTP